MSRRFGLVRVIQVNTFQQVARQGHSAFELVRGEIRANEPKRSEQVGFNTDQQQQFDQEVLRSVHSRNLVSRPTSR